MKSEHSEEHSTPSTLSLNDLPKLIEAYNALFSELSPDKVESLYNDGTNEEFLHQCMNFSPHGAMCQAVLISCLEQGLQLYLENPSPDYDTDGKVPLFNPRAWNATVIHLAIQFHLKYIRRNY